MELNLRKARKLESKLESFISQAKHQFSTSKSVRVNADVQSEVLPELVQARAEFFTAFDNLNSLIDARFKIRQQIAEKNNESGINKKILNKVILENKASFVNSFLKSFNSLDEKELEDESQRNKTFLANGDRFSRSSFDANFLLSSDEENFKKQQVELSKKIEACEDDLLALNFNTKITLSKDTVTLLQAISLL